MGDRTYLQSSGRALAAVLAAAGVLAQAAAQNVDVSARVEVTRQAAGTSHLGSSGVVLWLTPLDAAAPVQLARKQYTLAQKDKQFAPHILLVPVGSSVDFPNLDPFFHNVFSLFNGKRFDLGLYESHTHRVVQFDREGVSFIFCNIHPDMGAVVVALVTPYFGISNVGGAVTLREVPAGRYRLNVWAENVTVDRLNALSRIVEVNPQFNQLGTLHLETSGDRMDHHKNKFGEPYPPVPKQSY